MYIIIFYVYQGGGWRLLFVFVSSSFQPKDPWQLKGVKAGMTLYYDRFLFVAVVRLAFSNPLLRNTLYTAIPAWFIRSLQVP